MSSNAFLRSPWGRHWHARLMRDQPRPVWVDLARVFGQPPPPTRVPSGYRLAGEVRGELHVWVRTEVGWLGVVTLDLTRWRLGQLRQLVPAPALRARDDGRRINGTLRR